MADTAKGMARPAGSLVAAAFGDGAQEAILPREPSEFRATGSRRRKLWEIPHKFHCPLIGVCFSCGELRGLVAKVMHFPRDTSDFVLHTMAVGHCEERGQLAELLHKTLEKRYQLTIRQLAGHKSNVPLREAWKQACARSEKIPAVLWAIWSHPACDTRLEQDIYADIHMIQHQLGASTRAEVQELRSMEASNAAMQEQVGELRAECERLRREHAANLQALQQQILELRSEVASKEVWGLGLYNELLALRSSIPDLAEREELARQLGHVTLQNTRLKGDLATASKELAALREHARHSAEALESLSQDDVRGGALPQEDLSGKCVLCVGGRSGSVHSYRSIVEQSGGRFLHHDGGLEESLHRIDSALAAADIVICQAGCISHNAYWRVKDLCKRTGKPCMYVKASGTTGFERVVKEAARSGLIEAD